MMPESRIYSNPGIDTGIKDIGVRDFPPTERIFPMPTKILLTLLSALLVTLVFPPVGWWPLAPVAWIPLLLALKDTGLRASFRLGILHGLVSYGATLWWLVEIFKTLAPCLWLMLALFTGIFGVAFYYAQRAPAKWLPVIIATIWTGIEYYRSELFVLDFPWITPGTGFPPIALTSVVGVYGVSFLLVLIGSIFVLNTGRFRCLSIIFVSTIPLLFKILGGSFPEAPSSPLTVALVQNEDGIFDTHLELSEPHAGKVDAIVWPEYAVDFDPSSYPRGPELQELMTGKTEIVVLGGRQEAGENFYNTAFTEGRSGQLGSHVKNHTVHLFADGIRGTTALPVKTPIGKIGTPICFDCDYQDVLRKMTAKGAEFFLIPIMDAEAWTARQHLQHAELFRHRAVENGRWLAIAATSGKTQIISPEGTVVDELPLMKNGVLTGQIGRLTHWTLFQLGGWHFWPDLPGSHLVFSRALDCWILPEPQNKKF